jgi:glutathione peroxidase
VRQVVLIVNTASACGFTPQYAELQQLQDKYGKQGFTVLGFPCNQFGAQEPGSSKDIKSFTKSQYDVSFRE